MSIELKGTFTALVTPFNKSGAVDYGALRAHVARQLEGGVEGLVPAGTSGESPTLSVEEHLEVIRVVAEQAKGKAKVIAGTGANSTAEAIHLTKAVKDFGVDATLQVTPYYNKPNAEGLYRHFSTVAEVGVPVVLYNVPGRAGKEIPIDVVARLSKNPLIAAVKEAGGSVERVSAIRDVCDLPILSGDDSLTLPMIAVGAQGVISVASNVIPKEFSDFVRAALADDLPTARAFHRAWYRLFHDLFLDTNPICAKVALSLMGQMEAVFRLPLCEPSDAVVARLRETMKKCGIL